MLGVQQPRPRQKATPIGGPRWVASVSLREEGRAKYWACPWGQNWTRQQQPWGRRGQGQWQLGKQGYHRLVHHQDLLERARARRGQQRHLPTAQQEEQQKQQQRQARRHQHWLEKALGQGWRGEGGPGGQGQQGHRNQHWLGGAGHGLDGRWRPGQLGVVRDDSQLGRGDTQM